MKKQTTHLLIALILCFGFDESSIAQSDGFSDIDKLAKKYLNIEADELKQQLGLSASQNPYQANWIDDRPAIELGKLQYEQLPNDFPRDILKSTYSMESVNLRNLNLEILEKAKKQIEAELPSTTDKFTDIHEIPTFLYCDILNQLEMRSPTKDYLGSIECYLRAFTIYPRSTYIPVANFNLAISQLRIDALNLASDSLLRAKEDSTSRKLKDNAEFILAEIQYLQKSYNKAKVLYQTAYERTEAEELKIIITIRLGDISFRIGHYNDCYVIMSQIDKTHPAYLDMMPNSLYYYAESAFHTKRFNESMKIYKRLSPLWETTKPLLYPFVAMREADLLIKLQRYDQGKNLYYHIFRSYPGTYGSNLSAIKIVDIVLNDSNPHSKKDFTVLLAMVNEVAGYNLPTFIRHEVMYRQGILYIKIGEEETGIILLKTFCRKYKNSYRYSIAVYMIEQALKRKIADYHDRQEFTKLMTLFALNLDLIPIRSFNEPFLIHLCKAFDAYKLYRQIISLYEQIPPIIKRKESGNGVFHLWVAQAYTHLERNIDAITVLQNIPYKTNDRNILLKVFLYQAEIYRRLHQYNEALQSLEKLKLYSNDEVSISQILFWQAEIYRKLEMNEQAITFFRATLSNYTGPLADPGKIPEYIVNAMYRIADLVYNDEEYQQAIDAYQKFLKIFPNDYHKRLIQYRMNLSHAHLGITKQGRNWLSEATKGSNEKLWEILKKEDEEYYGWKHDNTRQLTDLQFID